MAVTKPEIQAIFNEAIAQGSDDDRMRYLDQACEGDLQMRARVEALLRAHSEAGGFFGGKSPAFAATEIRPVSDQPGATIGPYTLLQQIGEGGMGTVYMAEQTEPLQRKVALKVIKPGMDTRQVITRFEAERQALALMDHPHIARVLDAGTTGSGQPYFVMELVHGVAITKYCDQHRLTPRQRLELFIPVCQAIQHAHQKGIIHRDIKPSNVLVTLYDGKPVPKVIDFGVAKAVGQKLTDSTMFTEFGSIVGTLEYMSPEQAEQNQYDIDTRSDIYSLGVLLYELLTGTTPLDKKHLRSAAILEMLRIIKEDEPPRPSTRLSSTDELPSIAANRSLEPKKLSGLVRGELDWIVMKALEKDRNRRYETANGFALDLQRYLADEPVLACPPSVAYRVRKFARRNKVATAFATLSLMTLIAATGTGIALYYNSRLRSEIQATERQRDRADEQSRIAHQERLRAEAESRRAAEQEALARNLKCDAQMNLAHRAWHENQVDLMANLLDDVCPEYRRESVSPPFEWRYLWRLRHSNLRTMSGHTDRCVSVRYSPDGKQLASASNDQTVRIWDAATGQTLHTLGGHSHFVAGVAYSPNGDWIASGSYDKTVKLWDAQTGREIRTLHGHTGEIRGLVFSPDNRRLVSSDYSGFVKVWDLPEGLEVRTFAAQTGGPIRSVDFNPDGTLLALASQSRVVELWEAQTGKLLRSFPQRGAVLDARFSPDGKSIASADERGTLSIWEVATGKEIHSIQGHDFVVFSVDFSDDGRRLVSASWDQTVKVWDVATGALVARLKGHAGYVYGADFRADGQQVASCGWDQTVKLWDIASSTDNQTFEIHDGPVSAVSFSPDGRRMASASHDGTIKISDVATGAITLELPARDAPVNAIAFNPDGTSLASAGGDHAVRIWDAQHGTELRTLHGYAAPAQRVTFDADGTRIAAAFGDWESRAAGGVKVWEADSGREVLTLKGVLKYVRAVAFSPDGKQLAAACQEAPSPLDGRLLVWNTDIGQEPHISRGVPEQQMIFSLVFSPDSRRIFTGGYDNSIMAWDAQTGEHLFTLKGHTAGVLNMAISQDGTRLISASGDTHNRGARAEVIVWNLLTRQRVLTLRDHADAVLGLALSADGQLLSTAGRDGLIKIWNARVPADPEPAGRPSVAVKPTEDFSARPVPKVIDFGVAKAAGQPLTEEIDALRGAVAAAEALVTDFPDNPGYREQFGHSCRLLAGGLSRAGLLQEAEDSFRRALRLFEKLAADFPAESKHRFFLADTHRLLGRLLAGKGRSDEAEAAYRRAVELHEKNLVEFPGQPVNRGEVTGAFDDLAVLLSATNRYQEARDLIGKSLKLQPRNALAHNNAAWLLANGPDPNLRDPGQAVGFATKAVELAPGDGRFWNTLGAARYRAGAWKAAIAALEKSMELRQGGDSNGWFFLAMAHRQLGDKDKAREFNDRAVEWMDKNQPTNEELNRFRAEAAEVLELKEKKQDGD